MWQALDEIRLIEGITVNQFCEQVDAVRGSTPLTAAIRVAILRYYRQALLDRGVLVVPPGSVGNGVRRVKADS